MLKSWTWAQLTSPLLRISHRYYAPVSADVYCCYCLLLHFYTFTLFAANNTLRTAVNSLNERTAAAAAAAVNSPQQELLNWPIVYCPLQLSSNYFPIMIIRTLVLTQQQQQQQRHCTYLVGIAQLHFGIGTGALGASVERRWIATPPQGGHDAHGNATAGTAAACCCKEAAGDALRDAGAKGAPGGPVAVHRGSAVMEVMMMVGVMMMIRSSRRGRRGTRP